MVSQYFRPMTPLVGLKDRNTYTKQPRIDFIVKDSKRVSCMKGRKSRMQSPPVKPFLEYGNLAIFGKKTRKKEKGLPNYNIFKSIGIKMTF